ncbi:MAG: hypothetical protein R3F43_31775 [bacterium]
MFTMFGRRARRILRPMTPRDVPRALDIIRRFSEEDHEVAREALVRDVAGQRVLERDGEVLGLTGLRPIEGTEGACWLSWTYLRRRPWAGPGPADDGGALRPGSPPGRPQGLRDHQRHARRRAAAMPQPSGPTARWASSRRSATPTTTPLMTARSCWAGACARPDR